MLEHTPLKLKLNEVDLAGRALTLNYAVDKLALTSIGTLAKLPFQQLSTHLSGQLAINPRNITTSIDAHTSISLEKLQAGQLSSAKIQLDIPSKLGANYNLSTGALLIDKSQFNLLPAQWQSPKAQIQHQNIALSIAKFSYPKPDINVDFKIKQVLFKAAKLPFKSIKTSGNGHLNLSKQHLSLTLDKQFQAIVSRLRNATS